MAGDRREDVTKSLQMCWLGLAYCSGDWKGPEEGTRAQFYSVICVKDAGGYLIRMKKIKPFFLQKPQEAIPVELFLENDDF